MPYACRARTAMTCPMTVERGLCFGQAWDRGLRNYLGVSGVDRAVFTQTSGDPVRTPQCTLLRLMRLLA